MNCPILTGIGDPDKDFASVVGDAGDADEDVVLGETWMLMNGPTQPSLIT